MPKEGNFIDKDGNVLGRHKGLERYTPGQRRGLGISAAQPLYVLRKNMADGTVVLGSDTDLYTDTLIAGAVNWIAFPELIAPIRCTAKTRYTQKEAECLVEPLPNGEIKAVFAEPQRAITAGQSVVFYDGDIV